MKVDHHYIMIKIAGTFITFLVGKCVKLKWQYMYIHFVSVKSLQLCPWDAGSNTNVRINI